MRWTTNETYQFVKIYLKHEIMWNPKHIYHRRKIDRKKAMREICDEFLNKTGLTLTESETNLKIRTLQSTYWQELAKIKQRSGTGYTYTPRIKWFNDWHKCYVTRMKLMENESHSQDTSETKEENQDELSEQYIWVNTVGDNDNGTTDPFSDGENKNVLKSEPEDLEEKPFDVLSCKNKKQTIAPGSPSSLSDRDVTNCVASTTETGTQEDEFDIYGKYIASQLRKMELQKALRVQLQIQTVVGEARISELSNCD